MVPPSYFSMHYVSQARWVELWREAMRLDYTPIVDVRVIRPKVTKMGGQVVQSRSALAAAAAEVLKYSTKAADLVDSPEWLAAYIAQVRCLKSIASGGALKGVFRERSDDDLVHIDEDGEAGLGESVARWRYDWHKSLKRYVRRR
jgi:hypothetical protein